MRELDRFIDIMTDKFDMTYAEVIGTLQIKIIKMTLKAAETEDDK